jgi:biopolymer transport protein ExbD
MRKRFRKGAESADVNMTPMLDIVFILLIFFIVTATFLQEQGIQMVQPPPPEDQPESPPSPTILIQVDQRNLIFVCFPVRNCQLSDIDRVTANVQRFIVEAGGQAGVAISPHPDALHGIVTKVYDNAMQASPLGVVVRDPKEAAQGAA